MFKNPSQQLGDTLTTGFWKTPSRVRGYTGYGPRYVLILSLRFE